MHSYANGIFIQVVKYRTIVYGKFDLTLFQTSQNNDTYTVVQIGSQLDEN